MPSGRVRFFDAEKGFGFISKDGGGDVYVRASALPAGVAALKAGQRVEFGVIESRRGEKALSVEVVDSKPSLSKASRKKPEELAIVFEDLVKVLDQLGNGYKHGRYPNPQTAKKVATMLRGVADELEL